MKMEELIREETLSKLPLSFRYFTPINKATSLFVNRYVSIRRYQSYTCAVSPPLKPISKMI